MDRPGQGSRRRLVRGTLGRLDPHKQRRPGHHIAGHPGRYMRVLQDLNIEDRLVLHSRGRRAHGMRDLLGHHMRGHPDPHNRDRPVPWSLGNCTRFVP